MDDTTRVLVIEDDSDYGELMRRFLEFRIPRNNIVVVKSLEESFLTDGKFGVILMDLCLPEGRGVDLIKKVRQRWPHIPIVAMSGVLDESMEHVVMAAGVQDFLLKEEVTNSKKHLARVLSRAMDRSEILAQTMKSNIRKIHQFIERMDSFKCFTTNI